MARVLVSTSSFARHDPSPLDQLRAAGHQVIANPHGRKLEPDESRELLVDIEGLIAGTEVLDRTILESATQLRAISRCGVGVDQLDLEAAHALGIVVRRTSTAHVDAVAELALAGILSLLRRVATADRSLRTGQWRKPMGTLLRGKTVGVVGLGQTGRRLVSLLAPFETTVLATDPRPDADYATRHAVRYTALDRLLAASDVVSLHLDYSAAAHHLIGVDEIATMKTTAILVNCARGGLIDETALASALTDGSIAGAYLDVFESEPYSGALVALDNTVLTPHIGSYAVESRVAMETEAVANLIEALAESTR